MELSAAVYFKYGLKQANKQTQGPNEAQDY